VVLSGQKSRGGNSPKLIVIVGPTGVGKSRHALALAARFDGEIINGDSRQVYRGMDIGTAKPVPAERIAVPHHLFDIRDPHEDFNLPAFVALASREIEGITERGRIPFLVGGSGQYIWGLLEGWQVPAVAPDENLRREMERIGQEQGAQELYRRLEALNPEVAGRIDPRNQRRVIRALEVNARGMAGPISRPARVKPDYGVMIVGLSLERGALYAKTDARVEEMFRQGWVDETKKLVEQGCGFDLSAMNSIGYQQVGRYLRGELTLEEAKVQIKTGTHRLVRHQYAWFKATDRRICWFDAATDITCELMRLLETFLD
jgi:tRNA dimethylallyltransferase